MTDPVRLRLSRVAGFNLQIASRKKNGLAAKSVTRGRYREFGNPYTVIPVANGFCLENDPDDAARPMRTWYRTKGEANKRAVQLYRELVNKPENEMFRKRIKLTFGQVNPACYCDVIQNGIYQPCHADVILEIARDESTEEIIRENTEAWTRKEGK